MRSMQLFDNLFYMLRAKLSLAGVVDPASINFDCHKASIEYV